MVSEEDIISNILLFLANKASGKGEYKEIITKSSLDLTKVDSEYYLRKLVSQDLVQSRKNSRGIIIEITPAGRSWILHKDLHNKEFMSLHPNEAKYDLFISHSSKDQALTEELIKLFERYLDIPEGKILCTSVPGYKLRAGDNVDETLRKSVTNNKVVLGLISQNSMQSSYVLFELGAGWASGSKLVPVCIDIEPYHLKPPLSNLHLIKLTEPSDIVQLLNELSQYLDRKLVRVESLIQDANKLANQIQKLVQDKEHSSHDIIPPIKLGHDAEERLEDRNFSNEALMILEQALQPGNGRIMLPETKDGWCVQVDKKLLCETLDGRERAKWEFAIEQLRDGDLIKSIYFDDTLFNFTVQGYNKAEELFGNDSSNSG